MLIRLPHAARLARATSRHRRGALTSPRWRAFEVLPVERDIIHALATVVVPVGLTLGLAFWCIEFYRPETSRKRPWYVVLIATTAACVALTAVMFVTEL